MAEPVKAQPVETALFKVEQDYNKLVKELDGKKITEGNVSQVLDQIRCLLSWSFHMQGKTDSEIERLMREEVKLDVKKLQGTFNGKTVVAISVISGTLNIVGGIGGYASFGFNQEWLTKSPELLGMIGKGTDAATGIASNSDQSDRAGQQAALEASKSRLSDAKEARAQETQKNEEAKRQQQQAEQSAHQTNLDMARVR